MRRRFWSRVSVRSVVVLAVGMLVPWTGTVAQADLPGTASLQSSICRASVTVGVLPVWARGGFSNPNPRMPYVLGRAGKIAAILWAVPLRSPPPKDHNNKILWVSHAPPASGSDLRISARRMVGSEPSGSPVNRSVLGGPGPSIINLPSAGCWRLTLRWSGRVDTLDLRYVESR